MSIERRFTCDGPECLANVKTQGDQPPTFLTVWENAGFAHEQRVELHFCSWDCVLKYAATFEPTEILEPEEQG